MGPVELGVVMEELGRALYVGPYFSTVALAAQALTACADTTAQAAFLPRIADGSLTATVAVSDTDLGFDTTDVATTAERGGGAEWTVSGTKRYVVDGGTAGLILVAARIGDEVGLFAVDADQSGVRATPVETLDITRAVASVEFTDAAATRIDTGDADAIARAGDLATAAFAAEQIGGASAALDMTVEYAKIRVQFERPIGSFQAIKHRCADLLVQIESGRSAAFYAAALLADGDPEGAIATSAAAAWCATAYAKSSRENVQFHGGIGYTWECDAHLYLRRATVSTIVLGAPTAHRVRIADLMEV
ncbi:acyl-CoA dehydrogenase family protein [Gordonia humi]